MKRQIAEQQGSKQQGKKMMPQGVRTCGICGRISGHNARTCERLRLEEKIRQQMEKDAAKGKSNEKGEKPMRHLTHSHSNDRRSEEEAAGSPNSKKKFT